jgi:hypothetical protein
MFANTYSSNNQKSNSVLVGGAYKFTRIIKTGRRKGDETVGISVPFGVGSIILKPNYNKKARTKNGKIPEWLVTYSDMNGSNSNSVLIGRGFEKYTTFKSRDSSSPNNGKPQELIFCNLGDFGTLVLKTNFSRDKFLRKMGPKKGQKAEMLAFLRTKAKKR